VWAPGLWGFETWRAGSPDGVAACLPAPTFAGYSNWLRVDDGKVSTSSEYNTVALVDEFLAWWQATPSPRFAVLSLNAAHKGGRFDEWHIPPLAAMRPGYTPPAPPLTLRQRFLAMVESADYALERSLSVVDLASTLVIVTADNGTAHEVKPPGLTASQCKFSTFDGGVRVPGVVAGLRFPASIVSDQPASIVDIGPTLAAVVGVPAPPAFDGQSLVPALFGEPLERDWVYVQQGETGHRAVVLRRQPFGLWKLRELPSGAQFLYDLASDPLEQSPRSPDEPGLEDLAIALRVLLAEVAG
jgi:membrane-anchored protein YejM (alkaline phosphatase superfamily)